MGNLDSNLNSKIPRSCWSNKCNWSEPNVRFSLSVTRVYWQINLAFSSCHLATKQFKLKLMIKPVIISPAASNSTKVLFPVSWVHPIINVVQPFRFHTQSLSLCCDWLRDRGFGGRFCSKMQMNLSCNGILLTCWMH